MKRVLALVFLVSLATPAYAQTPFPPAEDPDDQCTSIPQLGGCEEEEEEENEEPNPAPDPAPAPSPAATISEPVPAPSAVPVAPAPPVTAPSPVAPEPVESLIPPMLVRRSPAPAPDLPDELAYTGPGRFLGLVILVVALIALGLYARGEGYRRAR